MPYAVAQVRRRRRSRLVWRVSRAEELRAHFHEFAGVPRFIQSRATWPAPTAGLRGLSHVDGGRGPGQAGQLASHRRAFFDRRAELYDLPQRQTIVRRGSGFQGLSALSYRRDVPNADVKEVLGLWSLVFEKTKTKAKGPNGLTRSAPDSKISLWFGPLFSPLFR